MKLEGENKNVCTSCTDGVVRSDTRARRVQRTVSTSATWRTTHGTTTFDRTCDEHEGDMTNTKYVPCTFKFERYLERPRVPLRATLTPLRAVSDRPLYSVSENLVYL